VAERLERTHEQQVLLEAVATPAAGDELVLEAVQVERCRAAVGGVEVLERDARGVGAVELGDVGPAAHADPLQVGVEVPQPGHARRLMA